jgi:hypothetical protein
MLSREDNELVCRTGPDTPMDKLFRRYWHPFLLSSELPEPDGPPVRIKLLGADRKNKALFLPPRRRRVACGVSEAAALGAQAAPNHLVVAGEAA